MIFLRCLFAKTPTHLYCLLRYQVLSLDSIPMVLFFVQNTLWWYARDFFVFFTVKIKLVAMLLTQSVKGSFVLLRLSEMIKCLCLKCSKCQYIYKANNRTMSKYVYLDIITKARSYSVSYYKSNDFIMSIWKFNLNINDYRYRKVQLLNSSTPHWSI